jgi:hypothetical protein
VVGKWRSIATMKNEQGPTACEIRFREDGTFHQLLDEGYSVLVEHDGRYSVSDNRLILAVGNYRSTTYRFRREGDLLVIEREGIDWGSGPEISWRVVLERNERPLESLRQCPRQPQSLKEAVDALFRILPTATVLYVRDLSENEWVDRFESWLSSDQQNRHLHSVALAVYGFGMSDGNEALLESCGNRRMHPNFAAEIVLHAFWKATQERSFWEDDMQ